MSNDILKSFNNFSIKLLSSQSNKKKRPLVTAGTNKKKNGRFLMTLLLTIKQLLTGNQRPPQQNATAGISPPVSSQENVVVVVWSTKLLKVNNVSYIGMTEWELKTRYRNHIQSFKDENKKVLQRSPSTYGT